VSEIQLPNIRLYYEEHGAGMPILCIHGTSSSARTWEPAFPALSSLGRVISYDRRGCSRSERPKPYVTTSVAEHTDDAAALLEALNATPAVVVGRSYGGEVALDLALRYPQHVRALVLLEPAILSLTEAGRRWDEQLRAIVPAAANDGGVEAVAAAFLSNVLGPGAWEQFPPAMQQMFAENGEAILAEVTSVPADLDAAALAQVHHPALLVTGADSNAVFHDVDAVLAAALPSVRTALVSGGHLINPADPAVLAFIAEVLTEESASIQ
jgi:pimeloyl-ACP methyl ester carboxylesterase